MLELTLAAAFIIGPCLAVHAWTWLFGWHSSLAGWNQDGALDRRRKKLNSLP